MQFHGHAEKVEDRAKDQIEYPNEIPIFVRSSKRNWASGASRALCPLNAIPIRTTSGLRPWETIGG
jgi:hypothetical protein